jgi:hypothetical protein
MPAEFLRTHTLRYNLESAPAPLLGLVEPIERGLADAVYGSRFLGAVGQATGPIHRFANWLLTWLSNRFTGLHLTDMETGQKAFRRDLIQRLGLVEDRFGIEPEITAKLARAGCRIIEILVGYAGRSRAAGKKIGDRDRLWTIVCIVAIFTVSVRVPASARRRQQQRCARGCD